MEVSEKRIKALAKIVHDANRSYCEILGDFSQKPWSEAPGYNHTSAMKGIEAVVLNPSITPEGIHDVWMEQKIADGWKYGPTKDYELKTHPSIVPYSELSHYEQFKDFIVIYNVKMYLDYLASQ